MVKSTRMLSCLAAATLAVSATLVAGQAAAQTRTYNFSGNYNFGTSTGTYTGSYTVDYATNRVTSGSSTSSAGTSFPGPPVSGASEGNLYLPSYVANGTGFSLVEAGAAPGRRYVSLNVGNSLDATAPTFSSLEERVCVNTACDQTSISRVAFGGGTIVAGPLIPVAVAAPVPTMSEWALILFGAVLAGSAALFVQRRRKAV